LFFDNGIVQKLILLLPIKGRKAALNCMFKLLLPKEELQTLLLQEIKSIGDEITREGEGADENG
jgi:hypothetical protein